MKAEDIRHAHINLLLQLANFNEYFIIPTKWLFSVHRFSKSRFLQREKSSLLSQRAPRVQGVLGRYKADKDTLTPQTAGKALIIFYASLANRGSAPGEAGE